MNNYEVYIKIGEKIRKKDYLKASAITNIMSKYVSGVLFYDNSCSKNYKFKREEKDIIKRK